MQAKVNTKNFIRYDEGAERYSMSKHSFMKLAQDARAVYKINRITLVNVKIFEEYLESFRAVSYTHLDVYKRQVLYITGCLRIKKLDGD